MNSDRFAGLGIGLLAGAAIGLAIGLLYAPRSGEETRAQLKEKAADLIERAKENASDLTHKVQQKVAAAKQGVHPDGSD